MSWDSSASSAFLKCDSSSSSSCSSRKTLADSSPRRVSRKQLKGRPWSRDSSRCSSGGARMQGGGRGGVPLASWPLTAAAARAAPSSRCPWRTRRPRPEARPLKRLAGSSRRCVAASAAAGLPQLAKCKHQHVLLPVPAAAAGGDDRGYGQGGGGGWQQSGALTWCCSGSAAAALLHRQQQQQHQQCCIAQLTCSSQQR